MQSLIDFFSDLVSGGGDDGTYVKLMPDFVKHARKFYDPPGRYWEPVLLPTGKTYYLLQGDPLRQQVSDRMMYLEKECQRLWTRLEMDPNTRKNRLSELNNLRKCLAPRDTFSRIAQKPLGGYDVRAYAHDSWIFIELPTFRSVETGEDGINLTEEKRRKTLMHILVHELAHVAGYWEHDDKHSNCIAWLTQYIRT